MAHDIAALVARARRALAPPVQKAAPPSLTERARRALAGLRAAAASPPAVVATAAVPAAIQETSTARKDSEDLGPVSSLPPKLVTFGGIPVLVDRPAGFVQRKLGPDGAMLWERTYQVDYGYLAGTEGGDGEGLDVFLGPDPTALTAWWAVQVSDDGAFDEYKLLIGFPNEPAARACYAAHIPEKYLASLTPMPVERLRALLGLPVPTLDPVTKASTLLEAIGEATGQRQRVELIATEKAATPDEQFIFGIVLVPEKKDLQREIYAPGVVRQTAHNYLAFFRNTDLQHKVFINEAVELVESTVEKVAFWMALDGTAYPADPVTGAPIVPPESPYRAAPEKDLRFVPQGTWTVAHRIKDPVLWADIKARRLTGYSINGLKKVARPPPPA